MNKLTILFFLVNFSICDLFSLRRRFEDSSQKFERSVKQKIAIDPNALLLDSVDQNNLPKVIEALDRGADINTKDPMGCTALMASAYKNFSEIVTYLLEKGANIECKNFYGETALNIVSQSGSCEMIKLLCKNGANINSQNYLCNTSLMRAVNENHYDAIRLLLKFGANISIVNTFGKSFLDLMNERTDLQKIFIEVNLLKMQKLNELIYATEMNDIKTVFEILIEVPSLINEKNDFGETVLNSAILWQRFHLIRELFENPAIKIKPSLGSLLEKNHPYFYARNLSKPEVDPQRKIYRKIADYLVEYLDVGNEIQSFLLNIPDIAGTPAKDPASTS